MKLAFKLPDPANKISNLIAAHDAPFRFCHVATVFSDGMVYEAHAETGVRFHRYDPDPTRNVFVELTATPDEEAAVRSFCEVHAGDKYDFCGVFAAGGIPFMKENPNEWYCSEIVMAELHVVGQFATVTAQKSPNAMYLLLTETAVNDATHADQ